MYLVQVSHRDCSGTWWHPRWLGRVVLRARHSLMIQQLFSWILMVSGPRPRSKCTCGLLQEELCHAWTHNHDVVRLDCSSIFSALIWTSLIKLHLKTRSCFSWRQKMDTVYQSLNVAYVLLTMIPDKVESILQLLPELWFTVTEKKNNKKK